MATFSLVISDDKTEVQLAVDGITSCRRTSVAAAASALLSSASEEPDILPPNTRSKGRCGGQLIVAVEVPSDKFDLETHAYSKHSTAIEKIPGVALPASLFIFVLAQNGSTYTPTAAYLFAMGDDRIALSRDKLYHFPTPNVYSTEKLHQICWGNNDNFKVNLQSPAGIEGLISTFFRAPFNYDLFGQDKFSNEFPWDQVKGSIKNIDEYFKFLAEQPKFDKSWLKPAGEQYATVKQALKTIYGLYK